MEKHDFEVINEGSIFLLRPVTESAQVWCNDCMPEDAPTFGKAYVIEHRYIRDFVESLVEEGYKFAYFDNAARPS